MTIRTPPLHVTIVVDSDAFGGAEVYARRLLTGMPRWMRTSLVVSEPVTSHLTGLAPTVVVPLARHRNHAPELSAALDELAPDVVHVNLVDPASNAASLAAAAARAPTVATLHLQGATPGGLALRERYRSLAAAIAPSAPIAAQLTGELGMPASRVMRIRHGVPLPEQPARPRGRPPLLVGAVGRLTPQKGFDLLLDAVGELCRRGHRLRLVIAGDGRDAEVLRRRAAGLPVQFVGQCRHVSSLLRALDVFCLPSRAETLSLALLEAAAHGLPCVATAVGDTAEALDGAALLVPPENPGALTDALDRVLAEPLLRRELGQRARERALRDFDVRRMAAQAAGVLARAATPGRPAPRRPLPAPR